MSQLASEPVTSTLASSIPDLAAGTYAIDPAHTEIGFAVRHLMTKVRGLFTDFQGEVVVRDTLETSSATVTVALSSVDTRNYARDNHLRSGDFFNVEQSPVMTFASSGLRPDGDGYTLTGDLTIRDVTRPVELEVEFLGVLPGLAGEKVIGFEARTSISRKDWSIDFNIPLEGGKLLIGDKVDIHLEVQAALQAEDAQA